jgi:hypothetical protein
MEADQEHILQSPLIRHGQAILSAGLIVIVAIFGLEDALIRNLMLLIAAVEIIVTPRVLKRIAES